MTDENEIEFLAGEHIDRAARCLVDAAAERGCPVTGTFNDVRLVAAPGMTAGDLRQFYDSECARRHDEWSRSDAGREARRRERAEVDALTGRLRDLLSRLDTLDFTDLDAVIRWLGALQPVSDRAGVDVPWQEIVTIFERHGFRADENVGDAFDGTDRANFARWLIGQALDCLQCRVHAIHPIFNQFAAEWRETFPTDDPPRGTRP